MEQTTAAREGVAHPASEVLEEEETGSLKGVFEDIRKTMRFPLVNLVFRALATEPDYFTLAWRQLHSNAQTVYFERRADEIRSAAVAGVTGFGGAPTPPSDAAAVVRAFHYVNPKVLIATAALRAATNGQLPLLTTLPSDQKQQVLAGVPEGMPTISLVGTDTAPEAVRAVFDDIKASLNVSVINTDYRALATWPEYLGSAWGALKPVAARPEYRALQRSIRRMADEAILSLPFRMDMSTHTLRHAGLSESQIDRIRGMLNMYYALLPGLVINLAYLTSAGEGRDGAARSPYPVTTQ
jgi:hypothetical protein